MELKNEIRKYFKEKRLVLSATEKLKFDDLLLIQFQKLPIHIPKNIMSYIGFEKMNEFDPQKIVDYCKFKNSIQILSVPVINDKNNTLQAVEINDESIFKKNKFGIIEPVKGKQIDVKEIEMVLIPLLAFDKTGNRVGYGKGFYDKFLQNCNSNCIKIGFSYFEPVDKIIDSNLLDIKLNYCITPSANYSFL